MLAHSPAAFRLRARRACGPVVCAADVLRLLQKVREFILAHPTGGKTLTDPEQGLRLSSAL